MDFPQIEITSTLNPHFEKNLNDFEPTFIHIQGSYSAVNKIILTMARFLFIKKKEEFENLATNRVNVGLT